MAKAAQFADDTFVGQKPNSAPSRAFFNVSEELRGSAPSLSKRNMVMDEDRFENKFLRCSVCKTRFGQGSWMPRLLPCHHSFCQPCVLHLFQVAKEHRQNLQSSLRSVALSNANLSTFSVTCPTCNINFIATEESILKLPTDHRIVQLMDFVRHTERSTISYCSKHNLQPLHFFCEPCVRPICRDCTNLDHKEVNGHLVMDLEEALSKYSPVLETAIGEMNAEANSLDEKKVSLQSVSENLDKMKVNLEAETRLCMDRLRKLISDRERVLVSRIHQEIDNEKTKLSEKCDALVERRKMLQTQTGRLKQAKDESNVEDMFHIHQEVKEFMLNPPKEIKEVEEGVTTSFALNVRDEGMLASRINNFGDVGFKVEAPVSRNTSSTSYYRNNSTPS